MAVGKDVFPIMHPVPGFRLGTTSAGIKKPGRQDLVVMEVAKGGAVAGVFTKNAFCAAPVQLTKSHIVDKPSRYLVTNTGNANAGTGESGRAHALQVCEQMATIGGVPVESVLPFSTGVIGEPLPVDKILAALPEAHAALSEDSWGQAAKGIMTTDTRPKGESVKLPLGGGVVTITGIAKGAGMIKPNMATMLAYVATDMKIDRDQLQSLVGNAADCSFNRITVDGDTSTNDCAMLIATGASSIAWQNLSLEEQQHFELALNNLFISLAQQIVQDGEGATKFVTVNVVGGVDTEECLAVAYTVAESPLVKTALFASDPNWGRILAAIGRAGIEKLNVDAIEVFLDEVLIAKNGGRADSYTEEQGAAVMAKEEIAITIDLHRGTAEETVWTMDFSHQDVTINADYRT